MKKPFIETKNVTAFRQAMQKLNNAEIDLEGMVVVVGMATTGKTVCARHYAARSDAVYIDIKEDMDAAAMFSALCTELGNPGLHSIEEYSDWLLPELEENPRLILVDNADASPDIAIMDEFRDIHDFTGSPVVFIGRPGLLGRIQASPRIWSRVVMVVEFKPVSFG